MTTPAYDNSTPDAAGARARARVAGLCGVLMLASGTFARFVSSRLIVRGDAAATSKNILASEPLFRLGVVAGLVMMIAFLLYATLLYTLLRRVHHARAMIMLALALVSVPIYMLNQVNQHAVLRLAQDAAPERIGLFLDLHTFGSLVAAIFFGLWLLPFGLLVLRSGFFPRALGALLMLGSPGYVALFVRSFLFPGSQDTLWTSPLLIITHVSELAMMLWLLIRGLNAGAWERRARESTSP